MKPIATRAGTLAGTPHGPCATAALEELRERFDTALLLRDVDTLDAAAANLMDPDALRADLLRLHAMAHTVLNGAAITLSRDKTTLVDQACDVEYQLDELLQKLRTIRDRVHQLTALGPSEHSDEIKE